MTVKIFAELTVLSVSVAAATHDRVFTSQRMAKSVAEAIAKRSAQDMVARINSKPGAPYDTFNCYGKDYERDMPSFAKEDLDASWPSRALTRFFKKCGPVKGFKFNAIAK